MGRVLGGVRRYVHGGALGTDAGDAVLPVHLGRGPRLGGGQVGPAESGEEHGSGDCRDPDPELESGAYGRGGGQGVQLAHIAPERSVGLLRAAQPAQRLCRPQSGLRVHQQPVHGLGRRTLGAGEQVPGGVHGGERAGLGGAGGHLVDQDAQQEQASAVLGVQQGPGRPQ